MEVRAAVAVARPGSLQGSRETTPSPWVHGRASTSTVRANAPAPPYIHLNQHKKTPTPGYF